MKIWQVIRTEAISNIRDRRTMASAFFLGPLFGPIIFGAATTLTVQQVSEKAEEILEIPVVGAEHAPNLVGFLAQQGIEVAPDASERDQLETEVRAGDQPLGLVIPEGVDDALREGNPMRIELIADTSASNSRGSRRRVEAALERYGGTIAQQRLVMRGVPPLLVKPVIVDEIDVSTPGGRAVVLLGMVTYFVLFSTLFGGMYLAIDATAGERERGSLEPLLILPVARSDLALGKVIATAIFSFLSMTLSLAGFYLAIGWVPLDELGMTANFGPRVVLGAMLVLAPFCLFGATLLNVVGAYTKSFKEAQSYLSATLLVPTLPILFATLLGVRSSPWLLSVPALSQHLIITDLLKAQTVAPMDYAMCWLSTLVLTAILAWALVKRYQSDALVG